MGEGLSHDTFIPSFLSSLARGAIITLNGHLCNGEKFVTSRFPDFFSGFVRIPGRGVKKKPKRATKLKSCEAEKLRNLV
jgi:hypothetical protein